MRYLLDTNIISYGLRNRDHRLMERIRRAGPGSLCTSVVVALELEYGLRLNPSSALRAHLDAALSGYRILALEPADVESIATVAATLRKQGQRIGTFDTMIAGHAMSRGLTLVTHNRRHFERVPGLAVEDWTG